jgi:hypothetical protein
MPLCSCLGIGQQCSVVDQAACAVSLALFDLNPARAVLLHHQTERISRQQLEAQMRQVQEDARNAQMSLVSQNGSLEGQCRAATERMKQLEVGIAAGDRLYFMPLAAMSIIATSSSELSLHQRTGAVWCKAQVGAAFVWRLV